ncbi:VWA domain-containing protein [Maribacter sp. ANRC-HE7]|uniref:VWA domain-containing protein n=1 Tax=Maribacter aquimaris TaxID=2737171 RepID=A0ABR7UXX3_9FLAO|nr:vWA domain-containing protein [Maribacter aquimaris]MBD0776251.1 VWA domain-containing protein [Maribacter aquimaris]
MQTTTVLAIILAAIAALLVIIFQYYYRPKTKGKQRLLLSFLRYLAVFCTFLLLINPKFIKKKFFLEKSNLIVLVDNSSSIKNSIGQNQVNAILKELDASDNLKDKFNIQQYGFGRELRVLDSLTFNENATDIAKGIKTLNTIFDHSQSAIVLLSDGNNTLGDDYEYYGNQQKSTIFPLVVGDTTRYDDLKIVQVNSNKYAFLKNKFPLEVFVSYDGEDRIASMFKITMNGQTVHSERLELSKNNNSASINVLLNAATVGLKTLKISLDPLENEKNIANNIKNIAIEVIDEKTNIAIVSELLHPDIGALKKSIESNEQRSVELLKPLDDLGKLKDVDLIILYQPTPSFSKLYDFIAKSNIATFTITGPKTNWNFLNKIQNSFSKNSYDQAEEVSPLVNKGFNKFNIPDIDFYNYPPLETNLGETMIIKNHYGLLSQKIKGSDIGEPLLVILDDDKRREAVLFGENLWKWRIQNYREQQNFNQFDELIGKIILYLSVNEPKDRLVLDYESFYDHGNDAKITVNYFDESFTFDPNAQITLQLRKQGANTVQDFPMLLKGGYYETDLSNMPSGEYAFSVKVEDENLTKSGSFNILDFDVEKQFTSSNYKKMERLADGTGGKLYFPKDTHILIDDLLANDQFKPIQKSDENVVPLVDFRFLLGLIIAALSVEWFIRKYNGLN